MKVFDPSRDIINQLSTVEEVISIAGSLFTGSATEPNIKKYVHWISGSESGSYYHSVFNTNYSTSTAIELVQVTYGQSISSSFYTASNATNKVEKNRVYKLYAKHLLGNENQRFSIDGTDRDNLIFVSIKRSQFKDELKKEGLSLITSFSGTLATTFNTRNFSDAGGASSYDQTSRGDRGDILTGSTIVGHVYYQAGILVLVPELVSNTSSLATNVGNFWSASHDYASLALTGGGGSSFENLLDGVRYKFRNLSFINKTNLHATFYFCRAQNDEFNYSSNPTFIDGQGRIIPTSGSTGLTTRTYATKVGLLGPNGEVLAVASLSQPIKKSPDQEFVIVTRLDF